MISWKWIIPPDWVKELASLPDKLCHLFYVSTKQISALYQNYLQGFTLKAIKFGTSNWKTLEEKDPFTGDSYL